MNHNARSAAGRIRFRVSCIKFLSCEARVVRGERMRSLVRQLSGKRLSSRVVKVDASEVSKPPNWKPAINEHEAVLKLQQAARAKQLQRTQAQFVCRLMHVQLSRAFTQWEEARAIERAESLKHRAVMRLQRPLLSKCWSAWRSLVGEAIEVRVEYIRVRIRTLFERLQKTLLSRGFRAWRKLIAEDSSAFLVAALSNLDIPGEDDKVVSRGSTVLSPRQIQALAVLKRQMSRGRERASRIRASLVSASPQALAASRQVLLKKVKNYAVVADRTKAGVAGSDSSDGNTPWFRMVSGASDGIQLGVQSLIRLLLGGSQRAMSQAATRFSMLGRQMPGAAAKVFATLVESGQKTAAGVPAAMALIDSLKSPAPKALTGAPKTQASIGKRLLLSMLRKEIRLLTSLLDKLQSSEYIRHKIVRTIEKELQKLHTEPQPLGDEGPMENYMLVQTSPDLKHSVREMTLEISAKLIKRKKEEASSTPSSGTPRRKSMLSRSVSGLVNRAEALTGLDLDRDGDVGVDNKNVPSEAPRGTDGAQAGAPAAEAPAGFLTGASVLVPARPSDPGQAAPSASSPQQLPAQQPPPQENYMQDMVNKLERVTGIDLDNDGDVGKAGSAQSAAKESIIEGLVNHVERMTGLDIDNDGDVGEAGGQSLKEGSLIEDLVNHVENITGLDIDNDGDVGVAGTAVKPAETDEMDAEERARAASEAAVRLESPVDHYLRVKFGCVPPLAEWLVRSLPTWAKASLPWHETWPHDVHHYDPPEVSANRDEWLKLEVDLHLRIAFGAPNGTSPEAAAAMAAASVEARARGNKKWVDGTNPKWRNLSRPQIRVEGLGCWPTLGSVEVVNVVLRTSATLWWEVFAGNFLLAFNQEENPHEIKWDIELGVGGCNAGLPDWLEDKVPGLILTKLLNTFTRTNPLRFSAEDPDADEAVENAAASKIQSRIRAAKEAKEAASQKRQSLQRSSPLGKSGLNMYQGKLDELSALANELKELSERTHEVYTKVNAAIKDLKKM